MVRVTQQVRVTASAAADEQHNAESSAAATTPTATAAMNYTTYIEPCSPYISEECTGIIMRMDEEMYTCCWCFYVLLCIRYVTYFQLSLFRNCTGVLAGKLLRNSVEYLFAVGKVQPYSAHLTSRLFFNLIFLHTRLPNQWLYGSSIVCCPIAVKDPPSVVPVD